VWTADGLTLAQRRAAKSIIIKAALQRWDSWDPSGYGIAFKDMMPNVVAVKIVDTNTAPYLLWTLSAPSTKLSIIKLAWIA
jgi:hypothetical protein